LAWLGLVGSSVSRLRFRFPAPFFFFRPTGLFLHQADTLAGFERFA